ncbi:MAG TPA: hypothetical protein VMV95_01575 [Bacillota bacterium]|nr:hypothetical protein [Bacillota bacterium]
MAGIKEYLGNILEGTLYTFVTISFMLPLCVKTVEGYKSGFFRAYNQAMTQNADMNNDGKITFEEEFKIRKNLHNEIIELQREGANLEDIVNFLKNK